MESFINNKGRQIFKEHIYRGPDDEVGKWCEENIPGDYEIVDFRSPTSPLTIIESDIYIFNEESALAFKLRWHN